MVKMALFSSNKIICIAKRDNLQEMRLILLQLPARIYNKKISLIHMKELAKITNIMICNMDNIA